MHLAQGSLSRPAIPAPPERHPIQSLPSMAPVSAFTTNCRIARIVPLQGVENDDRMVSLEFELDATDLGVSDLRANGGLCPGDRGQSQAIAATTELARGIETQGCEPGGGTSRGKAPPRGCRSPPAS